MENRAAFDGSGEVQLICMARYLLDNLKAPQSFEIEFRRGACGLNVSAEELVDGLCLLVWLGSLEHRPFRISGRYSGSQVGWPILQAPRVWVP